MNFAAIYSNAAVAFSWSPEQVDRLSLYQYHVAIDGYMSANDPDANKPKPPTFEEFDAWLET